MVWAKTATLNIMSIEERKIFFIIAIAFVVLSPAKLRNVFQNETRTDKNYEKLNAPATLRPNIHPRKENINTVFGGFRNSLGKPHLTGAKIQGTYFKKGRTYFCPRKMGLSGHGWKGAFSCECIFVFRV